MRSLVRRTREPELGSEHRALTWQAASLLLDYPDEALPQRIAFARRVSEAVPPQIATPLASCCERLEASSLVDLQAAYVETFDNHRRHSLFLTYFTHGDTRKRGVALLRFKQEYLRSGYDLDGDATQTPELPDHLCVVLEFAATVDADRGRRLLEDHRAGLEMLRLGLTECDSPWTGALQSISRSLTPLGDDELSAIQRLAAEGPPAEEVGLAPYAMSGFDPGVSRPDGAVFLPMPTLARGL